jgi:hypothetical protein
VLTGDLQIILDSLREIQQLRKQLAQLRQDTTELVADRDRIASEAVTRIERLQQQLAQIKAYKGERPEPYFVAHIIATYGEDEARRYDVYLTKEVDPLLAAQDAKIAALKLENANLKSTQFWSNRFPCPITTTTIDGVEYYLKHECLRMFHDLQQQLAEEVRVRKEVVAQHATQALDNAQKDARITELETELRGLKAVGCSEFEFNTEGGRA